MNLNFKMTSLFQKAVLGTALLAGLVGFQIANAEEQKSKPIVKFDFTPDFCDFIKIKENGANIVTCRNNVYTAFLSDTNGDLEVDNILWYNGKEFWSLRKNGNYFRMIDEIPNEKKVDFELSELQKQFIRTYREHNI